MNQFYTPGQAYRCRNSARHFYLRQFGQCGLCAADARLASFRKSHAASASAAKPAAASSKPAAAAPVSPPKPAPAKTPAPQSPPTAPAQQQNSGSTNDQNDSCLGMIIFWGIVAFIIFLIANNA